MELKFSAKTIARLEDDDMLGMSPMRLFFGDLAEANEDSIKGNAMGVFMSVKKLVMLISAGYDNDMDKAFEVYQAEADSGKGQLDIGNEVFTALQEGGYLGAVEEKKVLVDSTHSEKSGEKVK